MSGFVYAIAAGNDRVKIGWSSDLMKRLTKLQTDCPDEVRLLGVVPATVRQEQELHRLLAAYCISREWFRLEGAVSAFVSMLPRPQPKLARYRKVQLDETAHPLKRWRADNEWTLERLASAVGTGVSHLSCIENRHHLPSLAMWGRINKVTGLPLTDFVPAEAS